MAPPEAVGPLTDQALVPATAPLPASKRAKPQPRSRCAFQLRVQLMGVEPAIWRTVEVLGATTLHQLHEVIQAAMGWQDYHLYRFHVGPYEYGDPACDEEGGWLDARRTRLCDVLGHPGSACGYVYDFGDDWQHVVFLESIFVPRADGRLPRCTGGARACPPEDVGGVQGFAEFLQAIRNRRHPEHASYLEWVGGRYEPTAFDAVAVNQALRRFQPRRRRPAVAAPPTAAEGEGS